jgi:protoporphyrinogen oxidase
LNFGLWRGRRIAMGPARLLLHSLVGLRAALRGNGEKAARMAISARRAGANLRTPFVYPKGGMASVVTALARRLNDAGGTILLDRTVNSISVSNPKVTVMLDDGPLICRRVIFSSRGHAPVVATPGCRPPQLTADRIRNAVLHFEGKWLSPTGYVEVFADPVVKRLRNTGSLAYAGPEASGQVASVQLRSGKAGFAQSLEGSDLAEALLDRLMHLKLIDTGAKAVAAQVFTANMTTADRHACTALQNAYPEQLRFIQSTDFAEALVNQ